MNFTNEQFQRLNKELEEMVEYFNTHNPEQIGVRFRGTTAEACIFTRSDREVVELNALLRDQFTRIEQEHHKMIHLLDGLRWTLAGKIVETEEVKV